MATSKAKSSVKKEPKAGNTRTGKKSPAASKNLKGRKVSIHESAPNEDEIRAKAVSIYNDRLSRGEDGNAENDWLQAEKILREKKR